MLPLHFSRLRRPTHQPFPAALASVGRNTWPRRSTEMVRCHSLSEGQRRNARAAISLVPTASVAVSKRPAIVPSTAPQAVQPCPGPAAAVCGRLAPTHPGTTAHVALLSRCARAFSPRWGSRTSKNCTKCCQASTIWSQNGFKPVAVPIPGYRSEGRYSMLDLLAARYGRNTSARVTYRVLHSETSICIKAAAQAQPWYRPGIDRKWRWDRPKGGGTLRSGLAPAVSRRWERPGAVAGVGGAVRRSWCQAGA